MPTFKNAYVFGKHGPVVAGLVDIGIEALNDETVAEVRARTKNEARSAITIEVSRSKAVIATVVIPAGSKTVTKSVSHRIAQNAVLKAKVVGAASGETARDLVVQVRTL
jgi:hypothetical protein